VTWNEWLRALDRYMGNHTLLQTGVHASEPETVARLEREMAEDRAVIALFLRQNPHLHGSILAILMGAMQRAQDPNNSDHSTSVGDHRNLESDGFSSCCSSSMMLGAASGGESQSEAGADSEEGIHPAPLLLHGLSATLAAYSVPEVATQEQLPQARADSEEGIHPAPLLLHGLSATLAVYNVPEGATQEQLVQARADSEEGIRPGPLLLHGRSATLAVYNVPEGATQEQLVHRWPAGGSYDFLKLCWTNSLKKRVKVAYINFIAPELAARFHSRWEGAILQASQRPLVILAAPVQGRDLNIMLTLDSAPVPPLIIIGGRALDEEGSRAMVRHSRSGIFAASV